MADAVVASPPHHSAQQQPVEMKIFVEMRGGCALFTGLPSLKKSREH
jgi:hypothetical protein